MSKIVTCCVCGNKMPLVDVVSVGYSVAGWPVQVPVSLYACKDGTCRTEDARRQAGAAAQRPEPWQRMLLPERVERQS